MRTRLRGLNRAAHERLGNAAGAAGDWRKQAAGGVILAEPRETVREALGRFQQGVATRGVRAKRRPSMGAVAGLVALLGGGA